MDTNDLLSEEKDDHHTMTTHDSGKTSHNNMGNSPRKLLQHRHTYSSFNSQESLSKDEARRRMLSWRKTTKLRKSSTAAACGKASSDDKGHLCDRNGKHSGARKRGVFIGSKKSQSMGQY